MRILTIMALLYVRITRLKREPLNSQVVCRQVYPINFACQPRYAGDDVYCQKHLVMVPWPVTEVVSCCLTQGPHQEKICASGGKPVYNPCIMTTVSPIEQAWTLSQRQRA